MNLERVAGDCVAFYIEMFFVFGAYRIAMLSTAEKWGALKPTLAERLLDYTKCAGVVAVVALFASFKHDGEGEDSHVVGVDYERWLTVFLVLLVAAIYGATVGYTIAGDSARPTNSSL